MAMTSDLVTSKTEDSSDSFALVGAAETLDSTDISITSSEDTSSQVSSIEEGGTKVFLNVYDLNPINIILSPFGMGLHHSGIQINDIEYSFASKGEGIFKIEPKKARGVRFREQIEMGCILEEEGEEYVRRALEALNGKFRAEQYDLATNNCNHFCSALLLELLGKPLPGHVNRMSYVGTTARLHWFLPKAIRQTAPTGDRNLRAYGGVVPFFKSIVSSSLPDVVSSSRGLSLPLNDHFGGSLLNSDESHDELRQGLN